MLQTILCDFTTLCGCQVRSDWPQWCGQEHTLACYGWARWSGDWEQALVRRPFGWYTGDTCVNPLLKRGIRVCDKPLTQVHFVVFLHFVVAPNWSLFSQVGAQGHFCSVQRIKKRSGIFSTFSFSQLYKGNSKPYFQRIQHGHVSIFRCEVLIHLSANRGWRERFWHVNFGRHACWESTVRSHHISDRRNLHCLASSWTSHGSRNSWVYQQGPLVNAFFCGRIMCRLDSFDRLKDNVQLTAQDIKEHTFHAGEAWPNEEKKGVMFYAFHNQAVELDSETRHSEPQWSRRWKEPNQSGTFGIPRCWIRRFQHGLHVDSTSRLLPCFS